MKKILLALMIFSSLAFSQFAPTYILYNSTYYVRSYVQNEIKDMSSKLPTSAYSNYQTPSSNIPNLTIYEVDSLTDLGTVVESGTTFYYYMRRWVVYIPKTTDCSNGIITNGECVPNDPLECDPSSGTFTNLDGTCTDCSSHASDIDVTSVANCACGATGSTYSPSSVLPQVPVSKDKFSYTQSPIKCADGSSKYVYYNKAPIADTNNTTPPTDTNSTTPTDNNNTTPPTDGNSTAPTDGNGTTPNDGNGTSPSNPSPGTGKDYTSLLKDILGTLGNIRLDTKGIGEILNGDYAVTPNSHNIPTDSDGGSWDNYSEAWDNIVQSSEDVINSAGTFKSLVENGFSSPFTQGSVSSCSYTTSFDFGDIGSIPIHVDLCSVFSPLYGVFYAFSYFFFAFAILLFHVKMFLRLV